MGAIQGAMNSMVNTASVAIAGVKKTYNDKQKELEAQDKEAKAKEDAAAKELKEKADAEAKAAAAEEKEKAGLKTEFGENEVKLKKAEAGISAQKLKVGKAQHTMDNVGYTKSGRAKYKDSGKFVSHYDLTQMQQALKAAEDEQSAMLAQRDLIAGRQNEIRERLGM